jgi:hypothetical protein
MFTFSLETGLTKELNRDFKASISEVVLTREVHSFNVRHEGTCKTPFHLSSDGRREIKTPHNNR